MKAVFIFLAFLIPPICAEVFTAVADLETLLDAEKGVTEVIEDYIKAETKRLERLQEYAKEYQKRNQQIIDAGSSYIGNPINAFMLIKWLMTDWDYIESLMESNAADEFLEDIRNQQKISGVSFPDNEDLTGAAEALLRLQDTYRLETADITDGKIRGLRQAERLNAQDCFFLGRTAFDQEDYYHSLMWMQEAQNRVEQEDEPTADEGEILEYLAYSMHEQGNLEHTLALNKKLLEVDPDHPTAADNIQWYEAELAQQTIEEFDDYELPPVKNERKADPRFRARDQYEALCRGEMPMSDKDIANLYCYLKMDRPYLKLAPIKVEIVLLKPLAVLFKDVISDSEISVIIELAKHKLKRAEVDNEETGEAETASYRISKSAWLTHYDHPVIDRIERRIHMMTNLNMEAAEDLQIACYGLAGQYEPHYDHSQNMELDPFKGLDTGNRIATVLFYMSQPDAGGATVFMPPDRATVYPSHHDALFWYNLHKNGYGDKRTLHAACPVLAGTKWVANSWIHEQGQEFRRPCGLRFDDDENYVGEL